jgi:hypothetical protein
MICSIPGVELRLTCETPQVSACAVLVSRVRRSRNVGPASAEAASDHAFRFTISLIQIGAKGDVHPFEHG